MSHGKNHFIFDRVIQVKLVKVFELQCMCEITAGMADFNNNHRHDLLCQKAAHEIHNTKY